MKTAVRLSGGLGNQLFQYAYGLSLGADILLDYCSHYGLQLSKFNVTIPVHPDSNIEGYETYSGYWQSEKYFKNVENEVRKEFTLKNVPNPSAVEMAHRIQDTNSVAVHVRRGDYTGPSCVAAAKECPLTLSVDYYRRSVDHMKYRLQYPNFFLFSDDMLWAEANIELPRVSTKVHFQPHEDLWLMSQCKHSVMANSTFSWWGAWLNPSTDRQVTYPLQWFPPHIKDLGPDKPEWWIPQ